jgi:hypothetical protein
MPVSQIVVSIEAGPFNLLLIRKLRKLSVIAQHWRHPVDDGAQDGKSGHRLVERKECVDETIRYVQGAFSIEALQPDAE